MPVVDLISVAILPLELFFEDEPLGHATGFLWRESGTRQLYVVTNWHVVTAKDFFTGKNIHHHAGRPNRIRTQLQIPGQWWKEPCDVKIRSAADDDPLWLIHPITRCDIALIPFNPPATMTEGLYPLNEHAADELFTAIGMDVFIPGYPFEIRPPALPVWKRGSIASEPEIARMTGGYVFIDTASRPGMSGSPVLQRSWGHHLVAQGGTVMDGRMRTKVLGVYSGRVPTDHPHEAQIGLSWDKSYIDEIVAGNKHDE